MKYIIKYHDLYYNEYITMNGSMCHNVDDATKYVHIDIARQKIIDKKLPSECKVYEVTIVERVCE